MRIPVKPLTGVLLFVATLSGQVACTDSGNQADPRSAGPDAEAIARNNRAVGHMGRFEYANAQGIFSQLAERYPEWLNIRVNLAIATLNRQNEGDEATALQIAQGVLEEDETHLSAHYVAGLMQLYLGNIDQAVNHFRAVVNADATDPHASYYLAQALAQQSQHTEALEWYRKAIDLDPYLRSAYYGAFQTLRHLKRKDEAQSLIASYQKLANNPRAHLAEFKYTRMGEKAEVQAFDVAQKKPRSIPTGPVFDVASTLPVASNSTVLSWQTPHASRPKSITAVDLNNDGNLDLFLAGVLQGDKLHNLVLLNQPDNTFTAVTEHPLASVPDVNAAVWGDFDNDGLTDVYLLPPRRQPALAANPRHAPGLMSLRPLHAPRTRMPLIQSIAPSSTPTMMVTSIFSLSMLMVPMSYSVTTSTARSVLSRPIMALLETTHHREVFCRLTSMVIAMWIFSSSTLNRLMKSLSMTGCGVITRQQTSKYFRKHPHSLHWPQTGMRTDTWNSIPSAMTDRYWNGLEIQTMNLLPGPSAR